MSFALTKVPKNEDRLAPKEPSRIGFFLQKLVLGDRPEGKPVFLTLRHIVNGKVGDKIDSAKITELTPEQVQPLSLSIYETAANDAAGYGRSTQRYILQAYYEDKPGEEPAGRVVFTVTAGSETTGPGSDIESEPATAQGLVAALMRQNEHLHGQAIEVIETAATLLVALRSQVTDLNSELRTVRAEQRSNLELIEKARSEQWMRESEAKRLDADLATKRELIGTLKLLAPAVAKRVGLIDPRQPIPADEAAMVAMMESLTAEQMEKFLESDIFTPPQKMALFDLLKLHIERAEKLKGENGGNSGKQVQAA